MLLFLVTTCLSGCSALHGVNTNFILKKSYLTFVSNRLFIFLFNCELFYRNIDNLKILSGDNLDFIKGRIKDTALTCFRNYNANVSQHISNEEFGALRTLSKNCNLVIQKADKDNLVVIVEKDIDLRHMEMILSDLNKF